MRSTTSWRFPGRIDGDDNPHQGRRLLDPCLFDQVARPQGTDYIFEKFGVEFLQFNGDPTSERAGTVTAYNGLQGPPPLVRTELYEL